MRDFLKKLEGSKIDKITSISDKEFKIKTYGSGSEILIYKSGFLYITEYQIPAIDPTSFCKFLNKTLSRKKIISIFQPNLDRIVVFEFEDYFLIFELFSENLILCDKSYTILGVLNPEQWKDRTLKKGYKYEFPKNSGRNPFLEIEEDKEEKLNVSPRIVRFLKEREDWREILKNYPNLSMTHYVCDGEIISLPSFLKVECEKIDLFHYIDEILKPVQRKENKAKIIVENMLRQRENFERKKEELEEKIRIFEEKYWEIEEIFKKIKELKEKFSVEEINERLKNSKFSFIHVEKEFFSIDLSKL
jgi:predicted ribosome quality control (RQC) complex YloA/Tae2 family protein